MTTRLQSTSKKKASNKARGARKRPAQQQQVRGASSAKTWLLALGLALITVALYGRVAENGFVNFDDQAYVYENPRVQDGLDWQTVRWAFTSTDQANWHPLTWLSHALDCQFYGLAPAGHHITSLVFHLFNVLLLFWLLWKATGMAGRSFVVAALFAVHPFNVESVAWIAERKNVLSTLFCLLALAAYGWYARQPNWKRYALLVCLFALGLAAKPMLVTLPLVLLLVDYWPLGRISGWTSPSETFPVEQRSVRQLVIEKLPLLLLSAASSVVTVVAQRAGGAVASLQIIPYEARVEVALRSYALYILKMICPVGLAAYYPSPFDPAYGTARGAGMFGIAVLCAIFLAAVSFLVWRLRLARPYVLMGWLWYLGTLVPVIGIVQVGRQAMADRYAYVPLIGLFIAVVWALADLADRLNIALPVRQAASIVLLGGLSFLTFGQIGYWHDGPALWSHALEVTSDNYSADDYMASALLDQHNPEALRYFKDAARIAPWDPLSHGFVAAALQDQGHLREAIPEYEIVVRNPPNVNRECFAYLNLGIIYSELGNLSKANMAFERAQSRNPEALGAMIDTLSQAVAARPKDEGYVRLGLLLQHAGRSAEARSAFQQALSMNPGRTDARTFLNSL